MEETKRKTVTWAVIIFIVSVLLILALWKFPQWQVAHFKAEGITNVKDLAELEDKFRATLAQIIGGIGFLLGLYFTWRRITATDRNLEIARESVRVDREGQITERFTRAIDQLGGDKLEIRLGGIYALERIASDSQRDHWQVMEVLTAYIRENAPRKDIIDEVKETKRKQGDKETKSTKRLLEVMEALFAHVREDAPWKAKAKRMMGKQEDESKQLEDKQEGEGQKPGEPAEEQFPAEIPTLPTDIQAVLTVLGRRKWVEQEEEDQFLDLSGTDLRKADFNKADLQKARLIGANLRGAWLI
jgi:hypothetical protein